MGTLCFRKEQSSIHFQKNGSHGFRLKPLCKASILLTKCRCIIIIHITSLIHTNLIKITLTNNY